MKIRNAQKIISILVVILFIGLLLFFLTSKFWSNDSGSVNALESQNFKTFVSVGEWTAKVDNAVYSPVEKALQLRILLKPKGNFPKSDIEITVADDKGTVLDNIKNPLKDDIGFSVLVRTRKTETKFFYIQLKHGYAKNLSKTETRLIEETADIFIIAKDIQIKNTLEKAVSPEELIKELKKEIEKNEEEKKELRKAKEKDKEDMQKRSEELDTAFRQKNDTFYSLEEPIKEQKKLLGAEKDPQKKAEIEKALNLLLSQKKELEEAGKKIQEEKEALTLAMKAYETENEYDKMIVALDGKTDEIYQHIHWLENYLEIDGKTVEERIDDFMKRIREETEKVAETIFIPNPKPTETKKPETSKTAPPETKPVETEPKGTPEPSSGEAAYEEPAYTEPYYEYPETPTTRETLPETEYSRELPSTRKVG